MAHERSFSHRSRKGTSYASEIESRIRGSFTCHFWKEMHRTRGVLKRKELDRIVIGAIHRGCFSQVP